MNITNDLHAEGHQFSVLKEDSYYSLVTIIKDKSHIVEQGKCLADTGRIYTNYCLFSFTVS